MRSVGEQEAANSFEGYSQSDANQQGVNPRKAIRAYMPTVSLECVFEDFVQELARQELPNTAPMIAAMDASELAWADGFFKVFSKAA